MKNDQIETSDLENEINDLELNHAGEIQGGQTREHILLARQVGVPSGVGLPGDWNGDGTVSGGDYNR